MMFSFIQQFYRCTNHYFFLQEFKKSIKYYSIKSSILTLLIYIFCSYQQYFFMHEQKKQIKNLINQNLLYQVQIQFVLSYKFNSDSFKNNYNKNNISLKMDSYEESMKQSRQLAMRMRMGTGASNLLHSQQNPTHYIDSLERFQKDYASYDKLKRQEQKRKRQMDLEKKRIEQLQRQNRRWQMMEQYDRKLRSREQQNTRKQILGIKRTANSNGLAYNPISLEYEKNPEGERLRILDEDIRIRGYVRAHNMDSKGNCKYNLLNGEQRLGIDQVVPNQLNQRYQNRLYEHYQNQRIRVPSTSQTVRSSILL